MLRDRRWWLALVVERLPTTIVLVLAGLLQNRCYVSVTIVLMVMLMLVLARMLIFRTLVKRSTVHNNGDGDVNVRNDVKRSRKCLVL
jgi:hypothetical protein